jgi:GDP-4-dehydro-6-deoxy-D-mannose reductase
VERVLVTGCSGFVGRYLTDLLVREGYDVWGVDLLEAPDFAGEKFSTANLQSRDGVGELLDEVQPRHIVHLAAQSSGARSFKEPHATIRNNVAPALNILEHLRTTSLEARFLSVSSVDVYGVVKEESLPLRETMRPNPNNPYGLSKTMQEQSCTMYASIYGMDVVSTRSFNHTGAGRPDTFVLSSFAKQITEVKLGLRDLQVDVGDIELMRDFSDVRDVCRAYLSLLQKGKRGEIYNVCSGVSFSLRELLEKLAELAGVTVNIRVDESRLRPTNMRDLRGDNSKLKADTGWAPEVPIEETLRSLLDYWERSLRKPAG